MDAFAAELFELLTCVQRGDTAEIQRASARVEELKADSPAPLCLALIDAIAQFPTVRPLALVVLKQTVAASWAALPDSAQREIASKVIESASIFRNEVEQNVIVDILLLILQAAQLAAVPLAAELLSAGGSGMLGFRLRLLNALAQKRELFHVLIECSDACAGIVIDGLRAEDWDMRNLAINCFIVIAPLAEGGLGSALDAVLGLLGRVDGLDETRFISLWNAIDTILELGDDMIPLDDEQLKFVFSSAMKCLGYEQLSTTAKLQTLNALSHKIDKFDDELLENILNYSFELGTQIIANDVEYPETVCDVFRNAIDAAGLRRVYPIYIAKINGAIESQNLDSVMSLFLTKSLMDSISKQVKSNWETYLKLISKANQIDNEFVVQLTCEFVESFDSSFEKQIIEANLFLDYMVPLVVSKSNSLRHHAREAIYKAIDSISIPYKGLTRSLWKVSNQVKDEKGIYLTLLAKAITNEREEIDDEILIQISQFCQNNLNNQDVISGALALASVLLTSFENLHSFLLEPTFNAIQYCLESEEDDLINISLVRLQFLIPYFGNYFNNDFYQKIVNLFTKDDISSKIKESSLLCASSIAKISKGNELIYNIYNFCSEWSKSDNEELIHSSIQSILRIKDVLSPELIYEISINFGKMALESDNPDIVTDCIDFIGCLISESNNLMESIHDIGLKLSEAFFSNSYRIFKGKNKMDLQYEILSAFIKLISDMMIYKDDFCRVIYNFVLELIQGNDEMLLDFAFNIIYDGIKYNSFLPEEITQITMMCFMLIQQDIDEDLMQNFSYILINLVEHNLFTDEQVQLVYQWSTRYWCDLITKRALFDETLTNLALLQWTLLLMKSDKIAFNNEILQQTFEQFPPKSSEDSSKMTKTLSQISQYSNILGQFGEQIFYAILRLLVLPTLLIKQKGFTDDDVASLLQILREIISISPDIVSNIDNVVKDSNVKKNRIQQYLIKM